MVGFSAMSSSMHVHDYAEHDHEEHHHGPAAHSHDQPALAIPDHHWRAADDDHPTLQAGSCDPGHHVISITVGNVRVPETHVDLTDVPTSTIVAPAVPLRSAAPVVDVRVHGPPFDPRIPSRAPPLSPYA
jgi:hypothetical protein